MREVLIPLMLGLLVSSLEGQSSRSVQRLEREITALIDQPFMDNATWGIAVESLDRGDTLFSRNADKGFIPASNMKIFTTVFALDRLGPDYTYTTRVFLKGRRVDDSTFDGHIILKGSGDPTLSGRFRDDRTLAILEDWRDSLKSLGVRRLCGHVIGDDRIFTDEFLGAQWEWDNESYWYSAQLSGLSFNDNCVDYYVTPTKVGFPARIQTVPATGYLRIRNRIVTVASESEAREIRFVRRRASNVVDAYGAVALQAGTLVGYVTVENPTRYTATVFKELLERDGWRIDGEALDLDDLPGFSYDPQSDTTVTQIASYRSPPLSEILKVVNKRSQNFYAEQVLRTVTAVQSGVGSAAEALRLERAYYDSIGLKTDRMAFVDGSGYARTNQVSPNDILAVLKFVRKHRYRKTFYESLSVAGIDGTLRHRMTEGPAYGNVRAKTGFVDRVRSISGYVKTADGEDLVFSLLCNNFTVDRTEIERIQDLVLATLASFKR